ncbi:MAG TPA: GHKL domain-containing protein [Eubacteriales bacterium]|nr:GHKL domain-containing protein [Eubacteriales bacterium]
MNTAAYIALALAACCIPVLLVLLLRQRRRIESATAKKQSALIERHLEEVKIIYDTMRGWRHDYHNHIQTIKAHAALHQYRELDDYLSELDADLETVDTMVKSGNIMLDAIVNSKASLARSRGIRVNVKAIASEGMRVPDIDLCVIIGNLVDNAIDACARIEQEDRRFIRIYIGSLKGQLYISVTNATAETTRNQSGLYPSLKAGAMHGQGLRRVDGVVAKYGGYLNRQNEPGVFATEILLPL